MLRLSSVCVGALLILVHCGQVGAQTAPFQHKFEVFRDKDSDAVAFVLRLEQPFLAEEFEKSNFLRLNALDKSAYLIYPKEAKFQQKHAEFYGRLRGKDKAKLRLSYEIVSETVQGTPKVDVRQIDLEVPIPNAASGPRNIFEEWANHQNRHYRHLLQHYPEESFFQYVLLQSRDRYGVQPPVLDKAAPPAAELESSLYGAFTGARAVQEALQRQAFKTGAQTGDLVHHVSEAPGPSFAVADYRKWLEDKAAKKIEAKPHSLARFIPDDQYFLQFNSADSLAELEELVADWGDNPLFLFSAQGLDHRLRRNLEEQLCLYRDPMLKMFADGIIGELAVTGSDPFFFEGTDISLVIRVKNPAAFAAQADAWLNEAKKKRADLIEREFNYRGHKIQARYTEDRTVSSFAIAMGDHVVYSNSHRAIRAIADAATGKIPPLHESPDYRWFTTALPPSADPAAGYFYASEAFLRKQIGAELKIAERRRLLCFNNQVMLNNASLLFRLENDRSPRSLTELFEGNFADRRKTVCPHGGVYSWDARRESCSCSLHNGLQFLTPNAELQVLKISAAEKAEYERYRRSYEEFWNNAVDPVAARFSLGTRARVELCVRPLARNSIYQTMRTWVEDAPGPLDASAAPKSAVVSLTAKRGPTALAELLGYVPGAAEALKSDPKVTDLSWLGRRMTIHFCDGEKIIEIDPARIREIDIMGIKAPAGIQAWVAVALTAAQIPTCIALEVEDRDKAARFLELLAQKFPLQKERILTLPTNFDAYRLPDHKNHAHYVFSFEVHALKLRLHVALVGSQIVAATRADILREAIDAAAAPPAKSDRQGQMLLRLNVRALNGLGENVQLSWSEKSRQACHANTVAIHNLIKLYSASIDDVPRLSESIAGVRRYCPDHGVYEYDASRDQVICSVHGNRLHPRQPQRMDAKSSFAQFVEKLDEVVASLRFEEEALHVNLEIARRKTK